MLFRSHLIQFAYGVLTSASHPQTTYSDPLPSFNPAAADLPANPFAQATDNTELAAAPTDPAQAPAVSTIDAPVAAPVADPVVVDPVVADAPVADAPAADAPADSTTAAE